MNSATENRPAMESPAEFVTLVNGTEVVRHTGWAVLTAEDARSCLRLDDAEADWITASLAGDHRIDSTDQCHAALVDALVSEGFTMEAPIKRHRISISRNGIEFAGMNSFLSALHRAVIRHLPGRVAIGLLAAVGLAGNITVVAQLAAGRPLATEMLNPFVAAAFLLALDLLATVLHESAHGLVLIGSGRRIRNVGFGFYWGSLCYYVDATEALLLPTHRRMWQSAAGPLSDITVAGIAGLLSLIVPAPVSAVLLLLAALIWLGVAVNLVPFLELDGYWILADWLDRPQLRAESIGAGARMLRHPGRDRSRLGLYGIASSVFGVAILLIALTGWWLIVGDLLRTLAAAGWLGLLMIVPLALPIALAWISLLAQAAVATTDAR
jgi:putative peptide zinc metalloprotease protein